MIKSFCALLISVFSFTAWADCDAFTVYFRKMNFEMLDSRAMKGSQQKKFIMVSSTFKSIFEAVKNSKGRPDNLGIATWLGIEPLGSPEILIVLKDKRILYRAQIYSIDSKLVDKAIAEISVEQVRHKRRFWSKGAPSGIEYLDDD